MESEITDPNCIVKAFQNNNISIIKDEDNKYYFRGSDVAKALEITNIRSSIQNFTSKEKGVRKVDTLGGPQDIIFLSSHGVYRLLYSSKKKIAENFREWVGDILDDIIFNQSKELQKQLENQRLLLEEQKHLTKREVEMTLKNSFNKRCLVYLIKIILNDEIIYKFGYTDDIVTRLRAHKNQISEDIELVYCIESKDNKMLERLLIDYLEQYKFRIKRTINDKQQTELLKVNDIQMVKDKLIELNKDIENDKLLITKLKNKIIDLEIENIQLKQQSLEDESQKINELKNKIERLEKTILDYKLGDNKIKPFIENEDTVEDRIYKKRQVDKIDPTTLQIIETYECINSIIIKNSELSYNGIYRSIKKNNVYKDFRWNYNGEKINPTNKIVIDGNKIEKVIELDKNKKFVKIYPTKSELCKLLHIGLVKLNRYIEEEKILNEFYYVNESSYNGDIPYEFVNYEIHNSKQIRETNTETNEIIIYQTMKELYEKRGISRCTLRKCIKNNRVCDKYKWEYVNDTHNKNNSKRVKETNTETNEISVYDSMKLVYSKLNITLAKLRSIINNKEVINDCKYEFLS
jgi:prophage antirepressor-like protein